MTPVKQPPAPTPSFTDVDNINFEDDNPNPSNNNHFFLDSYQVNNNPLVDGMMVDDYAVGEDDNQGNHMNNPADELLIPTLGGAHRDDEDEEDDNEDEKMFK